MNTINDARWQEWADTALAINKAPMTETQISMLVPIFVSHKEDVTRGNFFTQENAQYESVPSIIRIALGHGLRIGLTGTAGVAAMIGILSGGSPGSAVIYTHVFRRIQQKLDATVLNSTQIVQNGFGDGFFSPKALQVLWDQQKGDGPLGNYLDSVVDPEVAG